MGLNYSVFAIVFIVVLSGVLVNSSASSSSGDYLNKIDSALFNKVNILSDRNVEVIVQINKTEYETNNGHNVLSSIGKVRYEYDIIPAVAMEIPFSKLKNLAQQDYVDRIVEDGRRYILRQDATPLIRANTARSDFGVNGTGIKIAIIDTGIYNHTEFQSPNRIIDQKCYCSGCCPPNNADQSNNATDDHGHGTHVAGISAGNSGGYSDGVAINASLMAIKVCNSAGSCADSDIISGIQYAVSNNASVISISLGGSAACYSAADNGVSSAVDNATSLGVTVVIAAGNSGPSTSTINSPGCAKTPITVGSVSKTDTISSFSSRGPTSDNRTKPDIVAPGGSINSTYNNGGYTTLSGTSMATPFVSGVAALVIEKYNKTFGYFPESGRVKAILMTAVNTTGMGNDNYVNRNNVYGAGRIDAYEALRIINFTKNYTSLNNGQKIYLLNVTNSSLKATLYWPENSTTYNNLDLIIQAPNSTNYTNPTHANDTVEQVFLSNITNGTWKAIILGINISGQQTYFFSSNVQIFNDTQPPQWSNQSSNVTVLERGDTILLSAYWTDNVELFNATLSTNETGTWKNSTTIALSGTAAWSNFTWSNSSLTNSTIVSWQIYANDTLGNQNVTNTLNFTIIDTRSPKYINITNSTDAVYSVNKVYQFNITWFDLSGISNVIFEWNGTTNTSNVTTFRTINSTTREYYTNQTDLAVGNYTYRWYANDTLNNWNVTTIQTYNVTQNTSLSLLLNIAFNGTTNSNRTFTFPSSINATAWKNFTEGSLILYRNGSNVSSGQSPNETIVLGNATYNYTVFYNQTQNFSSGSITYFVFVNKEPTSVSLWLNDTANNRTHNRGNILNITAQTNVSSLTVNISTNFTGSIGNINSSVGNVSNYTNTSNLNLGVYNITAYYDGSNSNYSASSQTYFLILRNIYSNSSINATPNQSVKVNTSINVTFEFFTNGTVTNGIINSTIGTDNPTNASLSVVGINKFLTVEANTNLTSNISYTIINVSYLDSEVSGIDESTLKIYYWNTSNYNWYSCGQSGWPFCLNSNVDTSGNFVWSNVTSFSNFTVGGLKSNGQSCSSDSICSSGACCSGTCQSSCGSTSPSSSGGGGGGGGVSAVTYEVGELTIVTKSLGVNDKVKFSISGKNHTAILKKLTSSNATLEINSTPITVTVAVNEIKKLDLNDDNIYDLSIKLNKIFGEIKADITFEAISEAVPQVQPIVPEENRTIPISKPEENKTAPAKQKIPDGLFSLTTLITDTILITIALVVIVIFVFWYKKMWIFGKLKRKRL